MFRLDIFCISWFFSYGIWTSNYHIKPTFSSHKKKTKLNANFKRIPQRSAHLFCSVLIVVISNLLNDINCKLNLPMWTSEQPVFSQATVVFWSDLFYCKKRSILTRKCEKMTKLFWCKNTIKEKNEIIQTENYFVKLHCKTWKYVIANI